MGIFHTLMSKILGSDFDGHAESAQQSTAFASGTTPSAQSAGSATQSPQASKPEAMSSVDVTSRLEQFSSENKGKLNWKTSIVDLMKLVGMDSSLSARKELAKDLNYPGDTNDSASMNIWLHKEVLKKIAENGGNLPTDLAA